MVTNRGDSKEISFAEYVNFSDEERERYTYNQFLESDDTKLATYKITRDLWLEKTELNKAYIEHELSRGTAQEEIISTALKMELGEERVITGQIVTIDSITGRREYSTQLDIIILKENAKLDFYTPTYQSVSLDEVLVVIEVKSKIWSLTGKNKASIESILSKPKKVELDHEDILFGVFGFEKNFKCSNLKRDKPSPRCIDTLINDYAPRNFIMAASDKYFTRKYSDDEDCVNICNHYYFEQGLAFGYFIANVLYHVDLRDGKSENESSFARFPMLAKTPAQVYP